MESPWMGRERSIIALEIPTESSRDAFKRIAPLGALALPGPQGQSGYGFASMSNLIFQFLHGICNSKGSCLASAQESRSTACTAAPASLLCTCPC